MKQKLFTLLFAIAASVGTMSAEIIEHVKIGDLYYNLDASNQMAEVTSGGNYSGSVVIPANVAYETTTTYSVTSIGDWAFCDCSSLTSVTIPNSVTSIGDNAFKNCSGLTSITIPNSVTSIRAATFYGCSSLTSVTIPNSVTDIGMSAFLHCTGLTSVTIPNSVTSIGRHAFMDCISLTSIAIPNSVTSIDNSVFTRCTSLTSIYVPCGELERFKQMMNNDSRVGYMPILKLYAITKRAENGNIDLTSETTICDESHPVCCLATPNYGYHFTQWSDGNTDNPQTIELTQDTTMEAIFAPNKYSISVACDSEQGQIEGKTGKFDYLTELTYTVIPNYGYHFTQWADGNTANPRTIMLTQDTILTALFAKNKYSINDGSNQNRGRINGIGSYDYLSERQIKAIPNRGYQFTQWSDGNTDNPRTIELTQDTTFAAIFDYILTGNCGQNNVLVWTLDTASLSLNITGSGALSENYTYGTFIKSLAIGDEITQIGASAFFANFVHLKKVTLGTGVKVLEKQAFYNCSAIDTIICYSQRPPTVNTNALYGLPYSTVVLVPAAYLNNYLMHDAWGLYDVRPMGVALNLSVNNDQYGVVEGAGTYASGSTVTFSAIPNYGYHLDKWSDGNTDNPRTITLTQDTILTAYFAVDKSGTCGADNRLQWSFTEDGTLTISGKGELTTNYTYGVEAPTQMKTLIIGNEVTAIGERAFYGKSTINHLVLGAQLLTIGDYAFAECKNFDDITCYAQDVPAINATTFANVGNKQYIYLYVPEDRERAYKRDVYWGEFDVQVKGASTTTTDDKVVTVEPSDNSASITWPTENNAASYTLQITKDGVVFCTLVFNSNGQLIGIAFAPSHDEALHAPAATMSVAGMTFTVTGLNTASKYAYRLAVADEDDNEIQAYSGEFATTGYQGEVTPGGQPEVPISTALDQTSVEQAPTVTKFIRDGQLFIQRDGKTYSVTGQEVK